MNNPQDTGALIPFPDPVIFLKNPVRSRFVFRIGNLSSFKRKARYGPYFGLPGHAR